MRALSEEISNRTLEKLITKPISLTIILISKYLSIQLIIIFCFLLSIPYFLVLINLMESQNG